MGKAKKKPKREPRRGRGKGKMGRPVELVVDLLDRVAKHVEDGNYLETAADLEGVSVDTLRQMMREGARELRRMAVDGEKKPAKGLERAVHFSQVIKKARAKAEADDLGAIRKAGETPGHWQARAWRLERRQPKRWGRRFHHEVGGKDGGPIRVTDVSPERLKQLTDEELHALEAIVGKLT